MEATISRSEEVSVLGDAIAATMTAGKSFQTSLALLRQSNHDTSAAASFWWTEGGGEFPPMALCARGLPDPFHYASMLTGRIAGKAIEGAC
jgi:type VI secretion system protein ImpM